MNKRKTTILVALLAAALAVVLALRLWPSTAATPAPSTATASTITPPSPAPPPPSMTDGNGAGALPTDLAQLVTYLRGRYGKHIDNPYVQIQMLEKLMRHFQAKNPQGWQAELLAAVRAAFPERYAQIAANLQHRLDYEKWIRDNNERLRGLGERERREAMWKERHDLFGADADQIWASELKNQAITDALHTIDARPGATVADRLADYKEAIQEAQKENADSFLQNHRQEALSRFLDLDSVQRELSSLSPADRSAALRDVRKGLGLDDAALARWDTLDQERDTRWDSGLKYMQERTALAQQYSGADLEARLQELRSRYFGAEAETIAQEEESGFFRFRRPRKWGLN